VAIVAAQLAPGRRNWRIAPDFDALVLQVDRRALRGALLQVLARVIRMTREGDWIGLRLVVTPETLSLVVEDDGNGLGAEDLTTPCTPCASADGERTRGLGFGLAIARSLLEAHGGGLRLEAVRDIGARAWLTLPRDRLLAGA
jgi:two-component system cell cycle sensor histidine kinase PleC